MKKLLFLVLVSSSILALPLLSMAAMTPNPTSLNFSATENSKIVNITPDRAGTWTADITGTAASWVTVTPAIGIFATSSVPLTITVNRTGVAAGTHSATLKVVFVSTAESVSVPISVVVSGPSAAPILTTTPVSPITLDFGIGKSTDTIKIKNTGDTALTFTITPQPTTWLAVAPLAGTVAASAEITITLTVSRAVAGLTPGMAYSAGLSINSNGGIAQATVQMTVPTAPPPPSDASANNEPMIPSGLSVCEMQHTIRGCKDKMQDPENALRCETNSSGCTNCLKKAGAGSCKVETCCVLDRIFTIADWIFVILIVVAAVFILWGSFEFVTSAGSADKVTSARNKLIWAIIGIVVAFLSQGLARVIVQIIAK